MPLRFPINYNKLYENLLWNAGYAYIFIRRLQDKFSYLNPTKFFNLFFLYEKSSLIMSGSESSSDGVVSKLAYQISKMFNLTFFLSEQQQVTVIDKLPQLFLFKLNIGNLIKTYTKYIYLNFFV